MKLSRKIQKKLSKLIRVASCGYKDYEFTQKEVKELMVKSIEYIYSLPLTERLTEEEKEYFKKLYENAQTTVDYFPKQHNDAQ